MEVSAVSTASASAFSSLTKNIDTFLTLLTTQLRNQDPLEPLDTEKFTSQLVQFASVEQSIKTNSNLEALIALQSATERDSALRFVGATATVATDRVYNSGTGAKWSYSLPQLASTVSIAVVNAAGQVVASANGLSAPGAHDFSWDGAMTDGRAAPEGVYRLIVSAKGANGEALSPSVETTTRITGAVFGDAGTQLETAAGVIPLGAVRRVSADI
jgi:flagellar basal-body rod modification protein FlgD